MIVNSIRSKHSFDTLLGNEQFSFRDIKFLTAYLRFWRSSKGSMDVHMESSFIGLITRQWYTSPFLNEEYSDNSKRFHVRLKRILISYILYKEGMCYEKDIATAYELISRNFENSNNEMKLSTDFCNRRDQLKLLGCNQILKIFNSIWTNNES